MDLDVDMDQLSDNYRDANQHDPNPWQSGPSPNHPNARQGSSEPSSFSNNSDINSIHSVYDRNPAYDYEYYQNPWEFPTSPLSGLDHNNLENGLRDHTEASPNRDDNLDAAGCTQTHHPLMDGTCVQHSSLWTSVNVKLDNRPYMR